MSRDKERARAYSAAYYLAHKAEKQAQQKAWRESNRGRENARRRVRYRLDRSKEAARTRELKYGITPEQQRAMRAAQGDACAICRANFTVPREVHVDHDHATGEVRGFLCGACNRAIGLMKDSPSRLRAAAAYLDRRQPKLRLVR